MAFELVLDPTLDSLHVSMAIRIAIDPILDIVLVSLNHTLTSNRRPHHPPSLTLHPKESQQKTQSEREEPTNPTHIFPFLVIFTTLFNTTVYRFNPLISSTLIPVAALSTASLF